MHLFKCAVEEKDILEDITSDKVKEAYHVIEMHNMTHEDYDLYIRTKLAEQTEEITLEEHFEKGRTARNIEIAKNLLIAGVDIQVISTSTGLPTKKKLKN